MMSSVFHSGPVTTLTSLGGAVLAGIGSRLHVYRIQPTVQLVGTHSILPGRVIHGIKQEPRNQSEETRLCVFGQKCLRVVQFDLGALEVKVITDTVELDDWLWDVAWLQGEERLSLALAHNVILIWDINRGIVTQTKHCAEKCILYCAKFLTTKEADLVLAAGTVFNQVVLWSPSSTPDDNGHIVPFHRLTGHQGVIFSIDYHPGLQRICSVSDDRSLRLYQVTFPNTDNGCSLHSWENMETSLMHVLYGHSARVWDVRLMTKVVVSIGEDATCCVWSYDGCILQKFKGHKGKSIWSLAVDTEEQFVVTGGGDSSIRLWHLGQNDTETQASTRHLDLQISSTDFPRSVKFLSEHLVVVMTNEGLLLIIDTSSNTLLYKMQDDAFASYSILSVSPRKHLVAIGNIQGTLRILSWNDGLQQATKISDTKLGFISDGLQQATKISETVLGFISDGLQQATKISDTVLGLIIPPAFMPTDGLQPAPKSSDTMLYKGRITSIIWLDNEHILSSGPHGQMNIWRLPDSKSDIPLQLLSSFELPDSKHRWASAATLSQEMSYLICGDKTGSVMLYSMTGRLVQLFPKIHKPEVTYVCNHGNQVYTAGRDGIYRLYDWGDGQLVLLNSSKVFKGFVWIERLTITQDGDMLIQGFNANKFIVWSVDQNQKLLEVESGGGHRSWDFILNDRCHGNLARLLYIKAREVVVKEIQLQSHQLVVKGCLHGREVCDMKHITSSHDSSGKPVHLLATCSEDTMVCLPVISYNEHNQPDIDVFQTLSGHISSVRCLCICESSVTSTHDSKLNRKLLFSAGGRAQMKIWRLNIECSGPKDSFNRANVCKGSEDLSKDTENCEKSEPNDKVEENSLPLISDKSDSTFQSSSQFSKQNNPGSPSTCINIKRNEHILNSTEIGMEHHQQISIGPTSKASNSSPNSAITCQYESLAGVLLGSHKKRKGKPWRVKEDNSDPETRILDMTVFKATELSENYPETVYFLTVACSDGLVRFFLFEEDTREITFIASSNFHNHCVLKVTHVIHRSDHVIHKSDHVIHKSNHVTSAIVLSAATDGKVAFWDITAMCKSVISDIVMDQLTEIDDKKVCNSGTKVVLEKKMQSQHTISSRNYGSVTKSNMCISEENVIDNAVDPVCYKESGATDLMFNKKGNTLESLCNSEESSDIVGNKESSATDIVSNKDKVFDTVCNSKDNISDTVGYKDRNASDNARDGAGNEEDQMPKLIPVGWLDCHQSGINSIYFGRHKAPDTYILITGGDDNAVHINLISLNKLVTKVTGSPGEVKVIDSGNDVSAHAAQITGIWYLGNDHIVTASIDQRVCIWAFTVQDSDIKLKLAACKFIDVPDIANIDVWNHGDIIYLAACGVGMELMEIKLDDIIRDT